VFVGDIPFVWTESRQEVCSSGVGREGLGVVGDTLCMERLVDVS
jgi:hypothetical protein